MFVKSDLFSIPYFADLLMLGLPKSEYLIIGSASLAREHIGINKRDIDIIASKKLWKILAKKYKVERSARGRNHIKIGHVDIVDRVLRPCEKHMRKYFEYDGLIDKVDIVDGFRFLSADRCLYIKSMCGREKDLEFLRTHEKEISSYYMQLTYKLVRDANHPLIQEGALIVGPDYQIISRGINDVHSGEYLMDASELNTRDSKLCRSYSAVSNAIRDSISELEHAKIYLTSCPVGMADFDISKTGIDEIIYPTGFEKPTYSFSKAKGIKMTELEEPITKEHLLKDKTLFEEFAQSIEQRKGIEKW